MSIKEKYFWIVIVGVGGAGIWLPITSTLLSNQEFCLKDIPPNMVTYFMSVVVSGCADKGMKFLEGIDEGSVRLNNLKWQSDFLNVIGIVTLSLVLVLFATLSSVFGRVFLAYCFGGIGLYVALKTYWNAHVKEDIMKASDAMPTPKVN